MLSHFNRVILIALIWITAVGYIHADAAPPPKLVEELTKLEPTIIEDSLQTRERLRKEIGALSDKDLEDTYAEVVRGKTWMSTATDLLLSEMIARGGPRWEKVVQAQLDGEIAADAKNEPVQPGHHGPIIRDLVLLTALRRIQKADDPLPILIEGTSEISCKIGAAPTITANLTNLDRDKAIVFLTTGGDYRGAGRHNRYRLEITDAAGKVLPEREARDMGGFLNGTTLESHDSYPMRLPIDSYVQIDKPGTYTMVVQYHPSLSLAYLSNVDGLVCLHSKPIKLIVEPVEIETNDAEQADIAALIAKLPEKGTVKILGGSYDVAAAGNFLPKDTPAAQIQMKAWNSVPALIRAANNEKLKPTQRAWALGLLYAITSRNDPMGERGVLGPYDYRFSGWVSIQSGGSYSQAEASSPGGSIDAAAQIKFAKRWQPWLENGSIQIKPKGGK